MKSKKEAHRISQRIINRLIVSNKKQFPTRHKSDGQANTSQSSPSWKKLSLFMLSFLIIPGAVAYASFFSFLGDIFTKVSPQEENINSLLCPKGVEQHPAVWKAEERCKRNGVV